MKKDTALLTPLPQPHAHFTALDQTVYLQANVIYMYVGFPVNIIDLIEIILRLNVQWFQVRQVLLPNGAPQP